MRVGKKAAPMTVRLTQKIHTTLDAHYLAHNELILNTK